MPTMPTTLGFTRLLTTLFIGAIICMGLCGAAQSARAEDVVDDGVIAHDVGHHKRTIENLFLFYQNIVPFEANGRESEAALLKKHKKEAIQVLSRFSQSSIGYSPEYALSSINEVIAEYLEKHKRTVVSTQESVDYRTAAAQVLTQYDPEHVTYILNFARFAFNLIKGFDVHTASAGNVEERSRWEEKFSWRASSIASLLAAPVLLAHAPPPL